MYTPITANDIALVQWKDRTDRGIPYCVGFINDFIFAECAQYSVNDGGGGGIAIRFGTRDSKFAKQMGVDVRLRGLIAVYRHDLILEDLKEGLWLEEGEINRINAAVEKILTEIKIEFIAVKKAIK